VPDVLIATDADYVLDDVQAALDEPGTTWRVARSGRLVVPACRQRVPDLVVLDLQVGTMGGVATCLALRHEESGGRLPHIPVVLLLDRQADVFLAKRSGAEAWLVKPLDPFRLRKAAAAALEGRSYHEGVPEEDPAAATQ